uniref:ATP synthase F0 subunit 8 n=1 Tax=Amritodus flavoscutatus TaxID=2479863 RepID=UPI002E777508|nr:ATP synthase F0 subunit 8 [Amritodus flavoscutatus]WQF70190.1 ATP synthase F0 subunit 8 [Amritodus flavoscutatus]
MPQMSPMWWLSLMLSFNLCYLVMMNLIYFNFEIKIVKEFSCNLKKFNWKW